MTNKISVNCQAKLSEAITSLTTMYREKKYVVVSLRPGKDRTLDQNALWFGMYKRIAEMTQIGDIEDARRYCKLNFGVQILLNEDEDFRAAWYRTKERFDPGFGLCPGARTRPHISCRETWRPGWRSLQRAWLGS